MLWVFIVFVVLVLFFGNKGLGILFGKVLFVLWCILIKVIGMFLFVNFDLMVFSVFFVVLLFVLIIIFSGLKLFKLM